MKKIFLLFLAFNLSLGTFAQIPPGYYDAAAGLSGLPLKVALHDIIKNHTSISYAQLWTAYQTTDAKPNGKVWDIYSDIPGGTPPYEFTFISDQCGSYNAEGDCYNREHSFPDSWFGGASPMVSDLFHVYPTDGWVNNKRGNLPYGDVGTATWTSQNGSKLGTCNDSGYSSTVFEPIDEYKGDLARTYFYMAVRYYNEDSGWPGSDMVAGAEPLLWARNVLIDWATNDSVSQKEINRNNIIYYNYQNNRNPFIDHPEWILAIWGPSAGINTQDKSEYFRIFPNPAKDKVIVYYNLSNDNISKVEVYSAASTLIRTYINCGKSLNIDLSDYAAGVYFTRIYTATAVIQKKLMVIK
jgi:endonuclease I